jgi:pyruvate/2-oxoglutarate dehydrogenase complex dihydrolipoamide dehydrogenase (E3) component
MKRKHEYDLAVIGAGSGGLVAAVGATKLGLSVVLINGGAIGGDCLNHGCVPSKALLQVARTIRSARRAARFGVSIDGLEVDYEQVKARVKAVQDGIRLHEDAPWFRQMGMDVIEEYAEFADPHTLVAGGRQITARLILIAAGSRAAIPPIPGLAEAGFVTNEQIFTLDHLPRHLAIIGGGPIGIEMAWAHRQLGSAVTVLEGGPEILGKDDPDMAVVVRRSMEEDGISIQRNAKVVRIERAEGNERKIIFERDNVQHTLVADQLLVAAGRAPNVEKLGLEKAGVIHDKRGIKVDASQRTNVGHIYAVGDVTGGLMFTHSASMQAGTFIRKAIFHLPASSRFDAFPWVTYTDPELASVGLNETEANKRGIAYSLATAEFGENDRARAEGEMEGKVKVLIEPSRLFGLKGGRILGAQIVGPHAGELIHEFVIMMQNDLPASKITGAVHAYPTLAEANKRAVSTMLGARLFQPATRKWLGRLFGFAGRLNPGGGEASHG